MSKIPFDLEKFKAGAVAVDPLGKEYLYSHSNHSHIIVKTDGNLTGASYEFAEKHWQMKETQPPKWIVFREFDSEEEAKEYAEFFGLTKFIWKIEKR